MDNFMEQSILLIEDNPGDVAILKDALETEKLCQFTMSQVDTLAKGMEELSRRRFDLVLLDLDLPDSHGKQTYEKILPHVPKVPVVILTGAENEEMAIEAVSLGVQDYLVKGSITSGALCRSFRYAIQRKRLEAALEKANATLEQKVKERTAELEESITALGEEVSQRRRVEKSISESQTQLRDMLDAMPVVFWMVSTDTMETVFCNKGCREVFGRDAQQLRDLQVWKELIHPEDLERMKKLFEEWLANVRQTHVPGPEAAFRVRVPMGACIGCGGAHSASGTKESCDTSAAYPKGSSRENRASCRSIRRPFWTRRDASHSGRPRPPPASQPSRRSERRSGSCSKNRNPHLAGAGSQRRFTSRKLPHREAEIQRTEIHEFLALLLCPSVSLCEGRWFFQRVQSRSIARPKKVCHLFSPAEFQYHR